MQGSIKGGEITRGWGGGGATKGSETKPPTFATSFPPAKHAPSLPPYPEKSLCTVQSTHQSDGDIWEKTRAPPGGQWRYPETLLVTRLTWNASGAQTTRLQTWNEKRPNSASGAIPAPSHMQSKQMHRSPQLKGPQTQQCPKSTPKEPKTTVVVLGHRTTTVVTLQNHSGIPTERRVSRNGAATHFVQIVQQGTVRRPHTLSRQGMGCGLQTNPLGIFAHMCRRISTRACGSCAGCCTHCSHGNQQKNWCWFWIQSGGAWAGRCLRGGGGWGKRPSPRA